MTRTIADVIGSLSSPRIKQLEKPRYTGSDRPATNLLGLAVASMRDHMTDEGWQIFQGLRENEYTLAGHGLDIPETDVYNLCKYWDIDTAVIQDKREWDTSPRDFRDPKARFNRIDTFKSRPDIFKVTILKDSHQRPEYHRQSAEEMDCHAWVCYYHPTIVHHLAPYTRPQHLIRTYHTIDSGIVPEYTAQERKGCILSGAISSAYPLRQRLFKESAFYPEVYTLRHPGYHRNGCATTDYLKLLSRFKVAICTSSVYGYALRKIIEATACGCVVITNLPKDEILPVVENNLVRIPDDIKPERLKEILHNIYTGYDPDLQHYLATLTRGYYSYQTVTHNLALDIEWKRKNYNNGISH